MVALDQAPGLGFDTFIISPRTTRLGVAADRQSE
jgi:hypothetical protein